MTIMPAKVYKMSKEGREKKKVGETNPGLYSSYYPSASYSPRALTVPVRRRTIIH